MNEGHRTRFINVDLDLASAQELTELVQAFEPGASPLNCWQVADTYFELALNPDVLELAAHVRARIVFVVYVHPADTADCFESRSKSHLRVTLGLWSLSWKKISRAARSEH